MASIYKPTYVKTDSQSGKKVNKKLRSWYIKYRDADGIEKRVKGFTDKEATRQKAAELERTAARIATGLIDRYSEHSDKPLKEHLEEFQRYLIAKGDTKTHVQQTGRLIRDLLDGCGFFKISDLSAARLQEWLHLKKESGRSPRTCNAYLIAAKSFTHWLVRERRTREDPFGYVSRLNQSVDVRRKRRALTSEQFERLIAVAHGSKPFRRVSGPDRALLYLVAGYTGLRASELASLIPKSFDLESMPATVTVEAGHSKHRKRDVLPLRHDLAERLRDWLRDRVRDKPLWPKPALKEGSLLIQRDLALAGIPYRDESGCVFDFHSLRHHFLSALAQCGVHPKTAQLLARHSSIVLTMDRYSHVSLADTAGALDSLPALPGVGERDNEKETSNKGSEHAPQHAPPGDISCPSMALGGNNALSQFDALARVGTETAGFANPARPTSTPTVDLAKSLQESALGKAFSSACTPACTSADPELARVVAVWQRLPREIRRAILALVEVSKE